jgi:hypothetical protein
VLAVADGVVVYVDDGMPDEAPAVPMVPKSKSDYGGNNVVVEITQNVFAWYAHLRQGSITVEVGDAVRAGAYHRAGKYRPLRHFGLLDKPDPIVGRSLPFVFSGFALDATIDFDASKPDRLVIGQDTRRVRSVYPLSGSIVDFP